MLYNTTFDNVLLIMFLSCTITKLYLIWHKKNYFKTSLTNAKH